MSLASALRCLSVPLWLVGLPLFVRLRGLASTCPQAVGQEAMCLFFFRRLPEGGQLQGF